jgi:hypothetical protein
MAAGPDFSELKDRTRQAWSLGNYSEVARLMWDEEAVRQRLDRLAASISFERRTIPFVFGSVQAFEDFVQNVGPSVARRKAVEPDMRERMRQEFHELIREFNRAGDGSVRIDSEYLIVVARKRG